jgi:hypothetical protein
MWVLEGEYRGTSGGVCHRGELFCVVERVVDVLYNREPPFCDADDDDDDICMYKCVCVCVCVTVIIDRV